MLAIGSGYLIAGDLVITFLYAFVLPLEHPFHDVSILRWMILLFVDAIVFISIGACFGGLVSRLAGFGTGLFALDWWLVVLTPRQPLPLL